ncbi:MAG: hypothetical protein AB7O68_16740 [Pirellulales bacterium]
MSLAYPSSSGASVEVGIWRNEGKDEKTGATFNTYAVRCTRSFYVPGENGQKGTRKGTPYLKPGDLLVAAFALQEAFRMIDDDKNGDKPF